MALPQDLIRLNFRGRYTTSSSTDAQVEEFSVNIMTKYHHDPDQVTNWPDYVQVAATKAAAKFATHWPLIQSRYSNTVLWRSVKAYHLNPQGRALHKHEALIGTGIDIRGGSSSSMLPPQCAVVVTLDAIPPEGILEPFPQRARGRFYLPAPATSVMDNAGLLGPASLNAFLDWAQAFINDLQGMEITDPPPGLPGHHVDVVIASSVDATARQVNSLRIGRAVDTQRRRRGDLLEQYVRRPVDAH